MRFNPHFRPPSRFGSPPTPPASDSPSLPSNPPTSLNLSFTAGGQSRLLRLARRPHAYVPFVRPYVPPLFSTVLWIVCAGAGLIAMAWWVKTH